LDGQREDERVKKSLDGLGEAEVLHEGGVPHEAEYECANEKIEHKHENFLQHFRLVAESLGNR
jgi:hypothetical protein